MQKTSCALLCDVFGFEADLNWPKVKQDVVQLVERDVDIYTVSMQSALSSPSVLRVSVVHSTPAAR